METKGRSYWRAALRFRCDYLPFGFIRVFRRDRGDKFWRFATEIVGPFLDLHRLFGQSAPYGPMAKPYHPCYTNLNPAAEARRYTSETIYCRKVTLTYDWLPPDREVKNWFRRVPYRLERGKAEDSWVVKYFEFRAGIGPLPGAGFIGDLWISWNSGDPSIWFKVEERNWEKWGGCASSVREVSLFFRGFLRPSPLHTHDPNRPKTFSITVCSIRIADA